MQYPARQPYLQENLSSTSLLPSNTSLAVSVNGKKCGHLTSLVEATLFLYSIAKLMWHRPPIVASETATAVAGFWWGTGRHIFLLSPKTMTQQHGRV